jgi:hypothetical protein
LSDASFALVRGIAGTVGFSEARKGRGRMSDYPEEITRKLSDDGGI